MANAIDYAKYFIKNNLDTHRNTFDGNMKIQKLLFFADFISIVERKTPLFYDDILAFSNGCVVENVRLRYKNDCYGLVSDSVKFDPYFTQDEYNVLKVTIDLFGDATARELSFLNHTFDFWKNAYDRSLQPNGFHDKANAIITALDMETESNKLKSVLESYKANAAVRQNFELINGIKFFFEPGFEMTDEAIDQLVEFSCSAEDCSYFVYFENNRLVIF